MKQKSILWSLLAMMVLVFSAGLVSCNDDDDDDDDKGSSNILGTWIGKYGTSTLTLTFNKNNRGTWKEKYTGGTDSGTFTYEMTSKTEGIIMYNYSYSRNKYNYDYYYDDDDYDEYFEIKNGKLYLYEGGELLCTMTKSGSSTNVDDDDDDDPVTTNSAVGTWKITSGSTEMSFTFKSNGSGSWYLRYNGETDRGSLSYSMSGSSKGSVRIYYDDGDSEVLYFKIQGKTMYIYEDSYYSEVAWEMYKQ